MVESTKIYSLLPLGISASLTLLLHKFSKRNPNSVAFLLAAVSARGVSPRQPSPLLSPRMAVEKESDDPYLDFRQPMLQMILEKEIYSKDELKHLLNCFLQLNCPYYHEIIVRAFTDIWNGHYSLSSSPTPCHHY